VCLILTDDDLYQQNTLINALLKTCRIITACDRKSLSGMKMPFSHFSLVFPLPFPFSLAAQQCFSFPRYITIPVKVGWIPISCPRTSARARNVSRGGARDSQHDVITCSSFAEAPPATPFVYYRARKSRQLGLAILAWTCAARKSRANLKRDLDSGRLRRRRPVIAGRRSVGGRRWIRLYSARPPPPITPNSDESRTWSPPPTLWKYADLL